MCVSFVKSLLSQETLVDQIGEDLRNWNINNYFPLDLLERRNEKTVYRKLNKVTFFTNNLRIYDLGQTSLNEVFRTKNLKTSDVSFWLSWLYNI